MLERGDLVPHFTVTTLDGRRVRYADLWQQKTLVLVVLDPEHDPGDCAGYATALSAARDGFSALGAELVLTGESLANAPPPCVVVADRWGEVYFAASGQTTVALPGPDVIEDWLEHIRHECPECQGEAR
jgi:hypothetical protein